MPEVKTGEELQHLQLKVLQWTVQHAYNGSPLYKERLDDVGVGPEGIQSLDDLQKLPFTSAKDVQEGDPYPLLSVPLEKVVRIHASSGTTGKRKVLCYTAKDVDDWADMMARAHEMAGIGFQLGCERVGAMAIPIGPGNMDM